MQTDLTRSKTRFFDFSRLLGGKDAPLLGSVRSVLHMADMAGLLPLLSPFMADIDDQWQVKFDILDAHGYDIDETSKTINLSTYGLSPEQALKSPYFAPQVILSLVESLRMTRHVEWLDGSLDRYHPESIMRIGRLCVADTMSQLVLFAWNAREAGFKDLWKTLLCGDCGDMATTFQKIWEHHTTNQTTKNIDDVINIALAYAFTQWFDGQDRVNDCDHDTLDLIDGLLIDGKMPAQNYMEPTVVTCLTLKAGGAASYIHEGMIPDIIHNPYYVGVADPINQAHLMQIIHDMYTVNIGSVAFRDPELAARFIAIQ